MDFSPVQLLIVLLIVLVIFGARRLPELGRSLGSSAREFKQGITGQDEEPADDKTLRRTAEGTDDASVPPPHGAAPDADTKA